MGNEVTFHQFLSLVNEEGQMIQNFQGRNLQSDASKLVRLTFTA